MQTVEIHTEFITLGQLLKYVGIISSGSEAKQYLVNKLILVEKTPENRRGKKLYDGNIVEIDGKTYCIKSLL